MLTVVLLLIFSTRTYETLNEEVDHGSTDSSNYDLVEALTWDQDGPQIPLASLSTVQSSNSADTGVNATDGIVETTLMSEDVDEFNERTRNMDAGSSAVATNRKTVFDMEDTSDRTRLTSISRL